MKNIITQILIRQAQQQNGGDKGKIIDFQERFIEIVKIEQRKILKKNEETQVPVCVWGGGLIICVIRVPREDSLVQKKISEEIMADIFPNLV